METNELNELRGHIDEIDSQIIMLLSERFKSTEKVGIFKAKNKLSAKDSMREMEQFNKIKDLSQKYGLNPDYAIKIYECIIDIVISRHQELKNNFIDK
ncbi:MULTISPECIES: chorismate mutase [unclassified Clostridium]|uniref:chorismate mutase n=1 Tax=unclassified Clostridium TaxID=2614128 RepID=UPI0002973185|nr:MULTISPECIES: chorismate mutase [unclassified Clostridium]EKQ54460.1 MAG: chorismate mutase [Clostridium sp. Maddingley MBC34-26]